MTELENKYKLRLLSKFGKRYSTFVETGTAGAVTSISASNIFNKVYTIELDFDFYLSAIEKSCKVNNVFPVYGDSGTVLGPLLHALDEPCVILLDAHYVGDGVVSEDGDTPIVKELEMIFPGNKETHYPHVVLIDDYRLFGVDPSYPSVSYIKEFCDRINYSFLVKDDIMVLTP